MKNVLCMALLAITFAACIKQEKPKTVSVLATDAVVNDFLIKNYTFTDASADSTIPLELRNALLTTQGASIMMGTRKPNTVVNEQNIVNKIGIINGISPNVLEIESYPKNRFRTASMVTKTNGLSDLELTTIETPNAVQRWTPIIPRPTPPNYPKALYFESW
jgi:hypothetical protein